MLIQQMRNQSQGVVTKIIVGLIIVVFALTGFGAITTFLVPIPKVATVNGIDITEQEMLIALERTRRIRLSSGISANDLDEDELRSEVLEQLVERELLAQTASLYELYYPESLIDQEILRTPAFLVDEQFDADQFQLVVRSAGYTPVSYKEGVRSDKKFDQLNRGVSASAFVTDPEVRRSAMLAQQTRDIAFLRVEPKDLHDLVNVSDDEITSYYHENADQFVIEEMVDLDYIELRRDDLTNLVEVNEAEIESFFEEERDKYRIEETRQAAHILIEINDEVSESDAKGKIDDIYSRIMSGDDFAVMAREFSQDPSSAAKGGDLGFQPRGSYAQAFEEALFSLSMNEITEPVLTEYGYHLIKLLDHEESVEASLDDFRERIEKDFKTMKAEEIFVERSVQLAEVSYEALDLTEPSELLDLQIKNTGFFSRAGGSGLASNQQVIEAAFSEDLLLDRNNSEVLEINANHHVVVRLRDYRGVQSKSIAAVREEIRQMLAQEREERLAKQHAEEMLAMLESGSITRFVADTYSLEWNVHADVTRRQSGIDQEVIDAAFKLPRPAINDKSVGTAVLRNGDAVVITVTKVSSDSSNRLDASNIGNLSVILGLQKGQADFGALRESFKASSDIEYN